MKRTLFATLTFALLALAGAAPSSAELTGDVPAVSGTIVVPAGAARAQRCAQGYAVNGTFGWILSVTPGKLFSLTTPAPSLDDVNIGFYKTITPCDQSANIAGSYTNAPGNESGVVPALATKAIIYSASLPAPPEHTGHARPNTPFTYTETTPTP